MITSRIARAENLERRKRRVFDGEIWVWRFAGEGETGGVERGGALRRKRRKRRVKCSSSSRRR